MDLQLLVPVQSVHITTNVVSSNPAQVKVYSRQHYAIKFVSDLWCSGTPVSSANKIDCQDVTEILLNVALNTIIITLKFENDRFHYLMVLYQICQFTDLRLKIVTTLGNTKPNMCKIYLVRCLIVSW